MRIEKILRHRERERERERKKNKEGEIIYGQGEKGGNIEKRIERRDFKVFFFKAGHPRDGYWNNLNEFHCSIKLFFQNIKL